MNKKNSKDGLSRLQSLAVKTDDIEILTQAREFRQRLLTLIAAAKHRVIIVALYLEDDEAGRHLLSELYQVKARKPNLDVKIIVDFHRAQRGLIGKAEGQSNLRFYREISRQHGAVIPFYGVPVQNRELFGVLHLKGMIVDNTTLYSGASINNVYLDFHNRYRLDRYCQVNNRNLADTLCAFLETSLLRHPAVQRIDVGNLQTANALRRRIRHLRKELRIDRYHIVAEPRSPGEVSVTPIVGCGRKGNGLNDVILGLLRQTRSKLVLITPYFNFPDALAREVRAALKRGVEIDLIVGDKVANDFYVSPEKPFTRIGSVPYFYEIYLKRFLKSEADAVKNKQLRVYLWEEGENTFHLKGVSSDGHTHLLTGSNLNSRAWRLDLENGLLIQDPEELLHAQFSDELKSIQQNTRRLRRYDELPDLSEYPEPVRRVIRRLTRTRADRLLKRLL